MLSVSPEAISTTLIAPPAQQVVAAAVEDVVAGETEHDAVAGRDYRAADTL